MIEKFLIVNYDTQVIHLNSMYESDLQEALMGSERYRFEFLRELYAFMRILQRRGYPDIELTYELVEFITEIFYSEGYDPNQNVSYLGVLRLQELAFARKARVAEAMKKEEMPKQEQPVVEDVKVVPEVPIVKTDEPPTAEAMFKSIFYHPTGASRSEGEPILKRVEDGPVADQPVTEVVWKNIFGEFGNITKFKEKIIPVEEDTCRIGRLDDLLGVKVSAFNYRDKRWTQEKLVRGGYPRLAEPVSAFHRARMKCLDYENAHGKPCTVSGIHQHNLSNLPKIGNPFSAPKTRKRATTEDDSVK